MSALESNLSKPIRELLWIFFGSFNFFKENFLVCNLFNFAVCEIGKMKESFKELFKMGSVNEYFREQRNKRKSF